MHTRYLLCCLILCQMAAAQKVDCNTLDVATVPGKWIWAGKAPSFQDPIPATQWKYCEPVRRELQRIMPEAPAGIVATNSIAFPKGKAFGFIPGPSAYECYLMIKDYECLKGYNTLQPEGVTGCWVYFAINQLDGEKFPLPHEGTEVKFHLYESKIRVVNIEVQQDAAGNQVLYSQWLPESIQKHCYFFSRRKGLPWRKLTNQELFTAYKIYHEKRLAVQIPEAEKRLAAYETTFKSLTDAEKQKQDYRWQQLVSGRKQLSNLQREKANLVTWYAGAMNQPNLNQFAYVKKVNANEFTPEDLEAPAGNGYHAWVDNPDFFDKTRPKDEPQCLAFYVRRQDQDLPKKHFMDLFSSRFNLDVLAAMVGEPAKKPNGINSLDASSGVTKEITTSRQTDKGPVTIGFDQSPEGQFPAGWLGMKNATVQSYAGSKWLTIQKDGYWYPRQYNREIVSGFSLEFDLHWNADISYYSGLFTVTLGEIAYDNIGERYRLDDNRYMYWSLYDGYAGNFNRVVLWFDPHWNGGGSLTVYSYDSRETLKYSKRVTLPGFFKEKNQHQLRISRNGNGLTVTDQGKTIADLQDVFLPDVKYNLFTFSRYKGDQSEQKEDRYYLNQIRATY